MELLSQQTSFGGHYIRYRHASSVNHCDMVFSVFIPPLALESAEALQTAPVVYWLSGLTCTDENFMQKAGAHRVAANLGLILIAPDTSPRGPEVPDDEEASYDFGLGAGFYINATQAPWSTHYHMYDYIAEELPNLVQTNLSIQGPASICGHSMGGHGALTIGLRHPEKFVSISAFSPIANPVNCPWGNKAFSNYLGPNKDEWAQHDACALLARGNLTQAILVDQGLEDQFLETQLGIPALQDVLAQYGSLAEVRLHAGYDHSYYFIASFIEDHLQFHAKHLAADI
jgi:S-formylglutathione hydrolase